MEKIEFRKTRWQSFLDDAADVRRLFLIRYNPDPQPRPLPHPDNIPERIDYALIEYQCQMERMAWLEDDALPYLSPYTGTEIFAEAFGCRVHRSVDTMPFALPCIESASQVAALKVPDLDTPCLSAIFEIAETLKSREGNGALLQLPDIQSPMDIAALIWDKNYLFPAFLETPEAVLELAAKAKQLLTAFLDEWFRRFGIEYIAHYPDYYMNAGVTLSEDEAGTVSPEMFETFFLPELVEMSRRYGGLGMHCCANSRHVWNGFRKIPNLRLLNLVQPSAVLEQAYPFFSDHTAQMHGGVLEGTPEEMGRRFLPETRVAIQFQAKTVDEARALSAACCQIWR